jgi:glycosyltransferase involved in cell wall biosynthesis/GT2 family glycosyltransferase
MRSNIVASVLVPTYQDAYLLKKSLPTLLRNQPAEIEVLILNNSPMQDVRASISESADDPRVRIVEMGFEAGFARAINRGIRESAGGLVMFCNADLFPTATYIAEMLRFFEARPRAGAAIGKLLRYDLEADRPTNVIDTAGLGLTRQRRLVPRGEGESDSGQFDVQSEVFAVDGAAPVVRRAALEAISVNGEYLDENFFAHKEDHDVSWRVRLAGWECWYVPSAVAYHGRTTRGLGRKGYLSALLSPKRAREVRLRPRARDEEPMADADEERGRAQLRARLPLHPGARGDGRRPQPALRTQGIGRGSDDAEGLSRDVDEEASREGEAEDGSACPSAMARHPSVTERPMRIAIIVNMVAPYTTPLFAGLAARDECELLVVSETPMERDRRWQPETALPFEHVQLDSWTLDLAPLAFGSGFRTRFDTYLYVPKRPLAPLNEFSPDVVVAGGGGIWSSPANIVALAARRRRNWAVVPWWGSFTREKPTWPRRLAEPWVRKFMRSADAWLVYGRRHVKDAVALGADPARTVIAPITALAPEPPAKPNPPAAGETLRFLFVGRLIERKGIDVLLEAFRRVDGGELRIVGDGPLREAVESAASKDARIRLLGHRDGAELASAYRDAHVLVVPSLYEPWGLVVHEGLAHGLPVIVTDQVGAGDDLIDSGTNGYVVPAGSAHALAGAMRAAARWAPEEWDDAARRSRETLAACSIDRGVDGFIRGCTLAVEHRRKRKSADHAETETPSITGVTQ